MPKLSTVQKTDKTLDVTVPIGDDAEPVQLKVYPNRVTLGTIQRAKELEDSSDLLAIAHLFFEFLHSWDLEGEDGKPLPFTDGTAKLLTVESFSALMKATFEAVRPNPTTSNS